ncbi:MAG: hypothetical protein JKY96_03875 [Phycisphaerales bacterium]|nr:hypothetical protein [Phycisphaerales bacterium]
MHRPSIRSAALLALAALCCSTLPALGAQPADLDVVTFTPPKPYQGQQVIRVVPTTEQQLQSALDLAEGIWSERIGVGPIELNVLASSLDAYRALGLDPVVLIEDLQARADLDWNRIVAADIRIAKLNDNQPHQRGGAVHDDTWFANFKQVNQIHTYINDLAAARPNIATVSSIGTSHEGRDLAVITITGPDAPGNAAVDRPVIIWNGCQHAREWVSPMTVTYLASRLVDGYANDQRVTDLIDSIRFVIIPIVNPDGYAYSWSTNRFWRKNRRDIAGSSNFGVDLNRNWGFEWGGQGSSGSTASDIYRGTSAFSEPETNAMKVHAESFGSNLVAHIDYHSYSQLILWPFGYHFDAITPEPDRTFFDNLANDVADEIFTVSSTSYTPMQSVDLYPAAGDSSDWYYGDLGAKSFTIELRPSSSSPGFDLPPAQILPTAQENWPGALLFAEKTTQLILFSGNQPTTIDSDTLVPVTITLADGAAALDPASPTLHYQIDAGAESTVAMNAQGGGQYTADLPATSCDTTISFWFTTLTSTGLTSTFPPTGTFGALATQTAVQLTDTMETNTGWSVGAPSDTATTGIWERVNPQFTDAQPEDDHTAAGTLCWITDGAAGASLGANDIDGGATTLTSPILDASAAGQAVLVYHRWYSNNSGVTPNADSMLVEISNNNGGSWSTLETVTENANAWVEKRFTISDFVTPTNQMRIRFVASDFGDGSIVEAGVDDLQILTLGCDSFDPDIDGNGVLNLQDIFAFLDLFNNQDPIADLTNDGVINLQDIFAYLDLFNAG